MTNKLYLQIENKTKIDLKVMAMLRGLSLNEMCVQILQDAVDATNFGSEIAEAMKRILP